MFRKSVVITLCMVTLLTGCTGLSRMLAPEPPAFGKVGDGSLNTVLKYFKDKYDVPAVTAFVMQNGVVLEKGAVGKRIKGKSTEVTLNDHWHIGSLTKAFTATLAAKLVEENLLDWNTTISDVFPELNGTIRQEYKTVDLVELLSHTSGLDDINESAALFYDKSSLPLTEQRRKYVGEALVAPAKIAVRGKHTYSNAGYTIAAAMFEKLTNKSWETLMREYILTPLGMSATIFTIPGTAGQIDQPRGHVYDWGWEVFDHGGEFLDNPKLVAPAGIMSTTLDDYSKFAAATLEGAKGTGNIISAESYAKLFAVVPDSGSPYALGWGNIDGLLTHTGSNGRWNAIAAIHPVDNYAIFIVTNMGGGNDQASEHLLGETLNFLTNRVKASH